MRDGAENRGGHFFENFFLPRNWYSIARKKRVYIRIEKDSICLTGGFPFYVKNSNSVLTSSIY